MGVRGTLDNRFLEFSSRFNKFPKDSAEYEMRKQIFAENEAWVENAN